MSSLTIAQAEASSATSGLVVADTAANIAAGLAAFPNLATKVASFTLSAAGTLSASQAEYLGALGSKMHLGGFGLTVSDSLANLANSAYAAGVALATSEAVVDAAYNLLAAPASRFTHVSSVTLVGSPTLTVANIDHLVALPHFTISPTAHVTLSDTAGNINTAVAGGPAWFYALSAIDVHLDSVGVGAFAAVLLEQAIAAHKSVSFIASGSNTSLVIDAGVANIANNAAALNILAAHVPLSYTLAGTADTVSAAQAAALAGLSGFASHESAVTVSDTAANLAAHPALFGGTFAAIDVTSGTLATTAANLLSPVLHLNGASVTLSASATVTAAQAAALTSLHGFTEAPGATLTVADTEANLAALSSTTLGFVSAEELTQGSTVTLTAAQADTLAAVPKFSNAGATIIVADSIANLEGSSAWTKVATATDVVDTAANILENSSLPLLTGASAVTLSAAGTVSAAGAAVLDALPHFSNGGYALTVLDTAANIAANLPAIEAAASAVQVNGTSSVTATQAEALATLPAPTTLAITSGAQVIIADSYANLTAAANAAGLALATGITVEDNGANLATAAAHNFGSVITPSYVLNQASSVSAQQLAALEGTTTYSANGYILTLADNVANVLNLFLQNDDALPFAGAVAITDTAANVTNRLGDITDVVTTSFNPMTGQPLTFLPATITISDTGHVSVNVEGYQFAQYILDHMSYATGTGSPLIVADTYAHISANGVAATLDADPHVGSVLVTDSVADMTQAAFDYLQANLSVPLAISLTDASPALSFTAQNYINDMATIDDVQNAASLTVTGNAAALAPIATTLAADSKVTGVIVTDSASAISSAATALLPLDSKLDIVLDAGGTVSAAMLNLIAGAGGGFTDTYTIQHSSGPNTTGTYALGLSDTVANVTALSALLLNEATTITVNDAATNLTTAALNTLESDEAALTTYDGLNAPALAITLTGTSTSPVNISASTYTADHTVIDKITNSAAVTVTDSVAAITPLYSALTSDSVVGAIVLKDTTANVLAYFSYLTAQHETLTSKFSATLTDTLPITAAQVSSLFTDGFTINNPSSITVADTGARIASVIENATATTSSTNTAILAFLKAATVRLSGNSVVAAADAAALEGLSSFGLGGYTLSVWDTFANLTSASNLAALTNADVSAIYLQTSGPTSLSVAQMQTLLALPHFYATTPTGTTDSVTVNDTAAHLAAASATFVADAAQLTGVSYTVSAPATVSDAVLTQLLALGATSGSNITVLDTAATIAANEPTQGAGKSIVPYAWDLSASATITLSQAETLGSIGLLFSANGYTLTLNQTGNTSLSVTNANYLGTLVTNLGSALSITGGGHFDVAGTVAQLGGLTTSAESIVTPQIIDGFTAIAGLTGGDESALLGGTITVNDSETVSEATAANFFGLIKVGNGAGILAANVSFGAGDVEKVSDTVTNLESLTGLPAYTANPALTSALSLVAADSFANLISSSNLSFLETVASSTLNANAPCISAAQTEQMYQIESEIHFSKGAYTVTVMDSSADLLNSAYAGGLGLADTLELTGTNNIVTAAGAEALLGNSKFALASHATLTIEDTAANLLDGTLGPLLTTGDHGSNWGANVTEELSAPATVNAATATELVGLPGFSAGSDLTISDTPAALLASSASTADGDATSITIPADEAVTAAQVLALSNLDNFTPGAYHLILGANDTANDATVKAIANLGSSFEANGHSITLTAPVTDLTQTQYDTLQNDNIVTNGNDFNVSSSLTPAFVASSWTNSQFTDYVTVPAGGDDTYTIFDNAGNSVAIGGISKNAPSNGYNTIHWQDQQNVAFSIFDTVNGNQLPLPIIDLDTSQIMTDISTVGAQLSHTSSSSAVYVGTGYLPLLQSAPPSVSVPTLVYSESAGTVTLETPATSTAAASSLVLITLGTTHTLPPTLSANDFIYKT
jgi:hypothetical protein